MLTDLGEDLDPLSNGEMSVFKAALKQIHDKVIISDEFKSLPDEEMRKKLVGEAKQELVHHVMMRLQLADLEEAKLTGVDLKQAQL